MKLYAPKYYRNFVCIADKCRHSCCIGWEIDVDEDTAKKYAALTEGYGNVIRQSIEDGEVPHFRLGAHDRCPHLSDRGLCRIILSLGEDYLCEICREHPRFYHDTVRGKEAGVGMACEEACRLILTSDGYAEFVEIEELDADFDDLDFDDLDFDALQHRAWIYGVLSDRSRPFDARLSDIGHAYAIDLKLHTDKEWRDLLHSLEYLDESHRALFANYASDDRVPLRFEAFAERALAYLIFRHCSATLDEDDFRAGLGFAVFCLQLLISMACAEKIASDNAFFELARILSEELEYSEENTDAIKAEF